jgi:Hemerythrin HHE cation binding domain
MTADTDATAGRYNIYVNIHKALRAFLCETLVAAGRVDADDDGEVAALLDQARALHVILSAHIEHENRFLHTAMEARQPGSSADAARDHAEHECALRKLRQAIDAVGDTRGSARTAASSQLYRRLALCVAENFEHMHLEETQNHAVLCTHYSDAEIHGIEAALVATLSPEIAAVSTRWMIPWVNHAERVVLLTGMRQKAPPEVFEGALAIAKSYLNARDWDKLVRKLALTQPRAA